MKKHIIITGGAQGIGKVTALTLTVKGFEVSVFELDTEALEEMQKETAGKPIRFYRVDVSNEEQVKQAVEQSVKEAGNLFGLVNNAAIHANKPLAELELDEWNRVIGTNLTGPFLCAKHASPFLKESGGRIINIASTRALQSEPNTEAYSASKGGIASLTHALAASLGPEVKVNCISPGWIDVSAVRKRAGARQYPITEQDHQQHPAGRVGKAEDIANMILFLLQPENDFITGQNFVVDGGMTKKMIYV